MQLAVSLYDGSGLTHDGDPNAKKFTRQVRRNLVQTRFRSGQNLVTYPCIPRPCAVVLYAYRYLDCHTVFECHGLAPWSFTLTATLTATPSSNATALRRGPLRSPLP